MSIDSKTLARNLTILAYEMNGEPVSVLHGAPLWLGVRTTRPQTAQMNRSDRVSCGFRTARSRPGELQRGPRILGVPDADLIYNAWGEEKFSTNHAVSDS